MKPSRHQNEPQTVRPLHDEADIGSGEKHPSQHETEEIIRQIPPLPPSEGPAPPPGSPPHPGHDQKGGPQNR